MWVRASKLNENGIKNQYVPPQGTYLWLLKWHTKCTMNNGTLDLNMQCQRRYMYAHLGNQINWRNNMKSLLYSSVLAVTVMGAAPAFAQDDPTSPAGGPVMLSAAAMDNARGGALINVIDVVDVNRNDDLVDVAVPIAANVAANILGIQGGQQNARPGRVRQ
jgi:hypothetical protein